MDVVERHDIRRTIEQMMMLQKQIRLLDEFAPVEFCLGIMGATIQMYDNESFEKVREAYEIPDENVRKSWSGDMFHKDAKLCHGFELSVVLCKNDDGYEVEEDELHE